MTLITGANGHLGSATIDFLFPNDAIMMSSRNLC